jgi:hypothetical protein
MIFLMNILRTPLSVDKNLGRLQRYFTLLGGLRVHARGEVKGLGVGPSSPD